jgi:hypothetical protein
MWIPLKLKKLKLLLPMGTEIINENFKVYMSAEGHDHAMDHEHEHHHKDTFITKYILV